ncbi:MAG: tryptophan 7-halogenase, partial [Nannocystaceae bacterium]|nr:tryptophan 7-halogenase [Nannocystaceae bacterium]
ALMLGVEVLDGVVVEDVELSEDDTPHHVVTQTERLSTRWVVDATGRRGLLKRKLDLAAPNEHSASSAWFRVGAALAVDDMSDDEAWQRQMPFGMRRLSTNHFMGAGYWLWWIPLADGSTSIGLVADPEYHRFDTYNTWPRMQAWLKQHEPATATILAAHEDSRLDFRTQKRFSYGAKQVFSKQRWALTGEAGVFVDPFYSPGSDFIAFSNDFITELVTRENSGAPIDALAHGFNRQYLSLYASFLSLYEGQYGMFGNAAVASLKIVYDYSAYWASTALLFFQRKLTDPEFLRTVTIDMVQVARLAKAAQAFFRDWSLRDTGSPPVEEMLNYQKLGYLSQWQSDLRRPYTNEQLAVALRENRRVLELIHVWLYQRATGLDIEVNPYKLRLTDQDPVTPTGRLDMLWDLDTFITARTEVHEGAWRVRATP